MHCVSLGLFVTSLLFYATALPLMLCSALLYRLCVPWSPALRRWAFDVLILGSVIAIVASSVPDAKEVQGWTGMWHHARTIFDQSWTLPAEVLLPFGSRGWYVLALAGLILVLAAVTARRLPRNRPVRASLVRWLTTFAGELR